MATYVIINCIVILGLVPAIIRARRLFDRRWWTALVALLVLTAVFDNVIIGLGIVGYDTTKLLGPHLGLAPFEDFFYAVAAMIIVPVLWEGNHE